MSSAELPSKKADAPTKIVGMDAGIDTGTRAQADASRALSADAARVERAKKNSAPSEKPSANSDIGGVDINRLPSLSRGINYRVLHDVFAEVRKYRIESKDTAIDKAQDQQHSAQVDAELFYKEIVGENRGDDPKFGPASREEYNQSRNFLIKAVSERLSNLVKRDLPIFGCPIPVPLDEKIDEKTKRPVSADRFKEMLLHGEVQLPLRTLAPNQFLEDADLKTMKRALTFLDQTREPLEGAKVDSLIGTYRQWIEGMNVKDPVTNKGILDGWLPPENMDAQQKLDWLRKASEYVPVTLRAGNYALAADDINRASQAGFLDHFSLVRLLNKNDFASKFNLDIPDSPVRLVRDSAGKVAAAIPDVPKDFSFTSKDRQQIERLRKFGDKLEGPVNQVIEEFDAAAANSNRQCIWGTFPADGEFKGEKYNAVEKRFTVEPVKVTLIGVDGVARTEDRLKVATTTQGLWLGDLAYNPDLFFNIGVTKVGTAETTGLASIQGQVLEPGKILSLTETNLQLANSKEGSVTAPFHIEARLTDYGTTQIRNLSGAAVMISQETGDKSKHSLAQADRGNRENGWVDLLPGDKLEVNGVAVELKNDVRLYRPTDWVSIAGGAKPQIMQADQLKAWANEAAVSHYCGEMLSVAMDVGMAVTGTLELKAAKLAEGKLIEGVSAAAIRSMVRNGHWHRFLGGSGLLEQATVNRLNSLGGESMPQLGERWARLRGGLMLTDMGISAGFCGKTAKSVWGTIIGESNEAAMKYWFNAGKFASDKSALSYANTAVMASAGGVMAGEAFLNQWVIKVRSAAGAAINPEQANAEAAVRDADSLVRNFSTSSPARQMAENLAKVCDRSTRELIELRQNEVTASLSKGKVLAQLETDAGNNDSSSGGAAAGAGLGGRSNQVSEWHERKSAVERKIEQMREAEAEKLAHEFLANKSEGRGIAAALALLRLRQNTDGSLPEILCTIQTTDTVDSGTGSSLTKNNIRPITLSEVEQALMSFRPVHLLISGQSNKSNESDASNKPLVAAFNDFIRGVSAEKLSQSNSDLLLIRTRELLAAVPKKATGEAAEEAPDAEYATARPEHIKEHISRLGEIYRTSSSAEDKTVAAIGLLLLNREDNGAISQELWSKSGWTVSILNRMNNKEIEGRFFSDDAVSAVRAARAGIRDGDSWRPQDCDFTPSGRFTERLTTSEMVLFLKEQLGQTEPTGAKLALADALFKMGQLSRTELGGICNEVLADKSATVAQRQQALWEPGHLRLAQLFGLQRDHEDVLNRSSNMAEKELGARENLAKDARTLQASLLSVVRNANEDADLRTLAVAVLHTGNIADVRLQAEALGRLRSAYSSVGKNTDSDASADAGTAAPSNDLAASTAPQESGGRGRQLIAQYLKDIGDISELSETRQGRYNAALSLIELGENTQLGIGSAEHKAAIDALISCVTAERESPTALHMSAQALSVLCDRFEQLTPEQQHQMRTKTLGENAEKGQHSGVTGGILAMKFTSNTEPEGWLLKGAALENLSKLMKGANSSEIELAATRLKETVNDSTRFSGTNSSVLNVKPEITSAATSLALKAIQALPSLSREEKQGDTHTFLKTVVASASLDPILRASALSGLNSEQLSEELFGLASDCKKWLHDEHDPELRGQLEGIVRLGRGEKINDQQPREDKAKAKADLSNEAHKVNLDQGGRHLEDLLTGGLAKSPLKIEVDQTPVMDGRMVQRFNAVLGDSDNNISAQQLTHLYSALAVEATKEGSEGALARDAIAFSLLSGGRLIPEEHRQQAGTLASYALWYACKNGSLSVQRDLAPIVELSLNSEATIARDSRRYVVDAVTWLHPGEPGSALSKHQAADILSTAVRHELAASPRSAQGAVYKESQDLLLHELDILSRYAGSDQLPLLAAIASERYLSSVALGGDGLAKSVTYADRSSRTVWRDKEGVITNFNMAQADGTTQRWRKEPGQDVYYETLDKKKEHPWRCKLSLEKNGDFIVHDFAALPGTLGYRQTSFEHSNLKGVDFAKAGTSPGGTAVSTEGETTTLYTRSGAKIETMSSQILGDHQKYVRVTYADGTVRSEHRQPGFPALTYEYKATQGSGEEKAADFYSESVTPYWLTSSTSAANSNHASTSSGALANGVFERSDLHRKLGERQEISRSYITSFRPDGSLVCQYRDEEILDDVGHKRARGESIVLETPRADEASDNAMPLVRRAARQMIANLIKHQNTQEAAAANDDDAQHYEEDKLTIQTRALQSLAEIERSRWFKTANNGRFLLIDGTMNEQYHKQEAEKELGLWWLLGYKPDYEKSAPMVQRYLNNHLLALEDRTRQDDAEGQSARAAFAYILSSGGRPLRSDEDRDKAVARTALLFGRIIRDNAPGAHEVTPIVAMAVARMPGLRPAIRDDLFTALAITNGGSGKPLGGAVDTAKLCDIAAQALDTSSRVVPPQYLPLDYSGGVGAKDRSPQINPEFVDSEKFQVKAIAFLQEHNYRQNISTLETLAKESPSEKVRIKAREAVAQLNARTNQEVARTESLERKEQLKLLDNPSERVRLDAASGFMRAADGLKEPVAVPEKVLQTLYNLKLDAKHLDCRVEADRLLTMEKYKYDGTDRKEVWQEIAKRLESARRQKISDGA